MRTQYRIWGSQKLCRANSSSHERLHGRERDQGVTNMVSGACHRVEDQACGTTHKLQRLLPATTEPKTHAGVQVPAMGQLGERGSRCAARHARLDAWLSAPIPNPSTLNPAHDVHLGTPRLAIHALALLLLPV